MERNLHQGLEFLGRCLSKIYDLPVVEGLALIALQNVAATVFGPNKRIAWLAYHFDNKNKIRKEIMRNEYVSRRGTMTNSWSRNQNTVRHTGKSLGNLSLTAIFGLMVLIVGLIYATQGVKATSYDYELSNIEDEITELTAKKEDLAVERARLTSIAAAENSEVAAAMPDGNASGYANE